MPRAFLFVSFELQYSRIILLSDGTQLGRLRATARGRGLRLQECAHIDKKNAPLSRKREEERSEKEAKTENTEKQTKGQRNREPNKCKILHKVTLIYNHI
jgi:hypothetical protein